jgi:subtilisin
MEENLFYNGSMCLVRPAWVNNSLQNITGRNIKVAVIDSGCDIGLWNDCRIDKGISFVQDDTSFECEQNPDYADKIGHGTTCIDRILQIAPGVKIIPVKIFNKRLQTGPNILIKAISFAIENEVNIINLSLSSKLEELLQPLYALCEQAKNKNITIVASHSNQEETSYPAIFENVISVSDKHFDSTFDFAYYEDEFVECNAQGESLDALGLNHIRRPSSGNSFAAPVISGIIALCLEKYGPQDLYRIRLLLKKLSINGRV